MKCKYCGKEFAQKKRNHFYCCPKCRYEDRYKKTEKICLGCNKLFLPTHKNQQYCHIGCRNNFYATEHVKPITTKKAKHKNTTKELISYSKEAKKAGISYGMLTAQKVKIERKW